ncbi:hypothetical protein [Emticicia sp. BO119]|uniref:hypothetical protein n=1 Tax=Emticicia sp. BO119 TaxID=2757768 RepID=UPI0015F012DB|nr:hypothetical protein [Emticicia sp. BO119]MBA4849679.1 hypothetical protein [Emticicia sp. BO119]
MIRIYFDWNVISNYKREDFLDFRSFIELHKDYLQFPYSPAHFSDLMKSYKPDNPYFNEDLNNLDFLAERHFLRWGKNGMEFLFCSPKEYFEIEKEREDLFPLINMEEIIKDLDEIDVGNGKIETLFKEIFESLPINLPNKVEKEETFKKMLPYLNENSTVWDLMNNIFPFAKKLLQDKEYYKDFRKTIADNGFKLDPNSGNWEIDDVINNIDAFLHERGLNLTFSEYVKSSFEHRKEPITKYEYYTNAYLMLDMIGYKSDKLPKPTDNMQNIHNDAEHSFYAAHCDFFVVADKKLRVKAKVLYHQLNIQTIVISPEDFIGTIKEKMHIQNLDQHFLNAVFTLIKSENLIESYAKSEGNEVEIFAFKLPIFYFNFFNFVVYEDYPEHEGVIITFKRAFKNFSRGIFFTESERVINRVSKFFGYENEEDLTLKIKKFVYSDEKVDFIWKFEAGFVKLERDEETKRPILVYIVSSKQLI